MYLSLLFMFVNGIGSVPLPASKPREPTLIKRVQNQGSRVNIVPC